MVAPHSILSILTGGAWILTNRTTTRNGTLLDDPDRPLGLQPGGIILYHPNGYMSATMASTNSSQQPTGIYPYQKGDDIEPWSLLGIHSLCYSGPFSFTGRNEVPGKMQGEILHGPVIMSNIPDWVGSDQLRNFTIFEEGEDKWSLRLRITNETTAVQGDIWWTRI